MNRELVVLVIDRSEETSQVLQTALCEREVAVLHADGAASGLALAKVHLPNLIILDLDLETKWNEAVLFAFCKELSGYHTPLILLGNRRRGSRLLPGEVVAKPYHFGPLIRKIEQQLDQMRVREKDCGIAVRDSGA